MSAQRLALYEQSRDEAEARVLEHLGVVKRVALHLHARVPRFIDVDDLTQAGMLGLIAAARVYDASRGGNFEYFAYVRIRGAMFDEVRRLSQLPRSAVAILKSHERSEAELAARIGRAPTQAELATFMNKDAESLHRERGEAIRFETTSIETLGEPVENIADGDQARPDVVVENRQFMEALERAIERLPEREKTIIALYYVEEMNLREIGAVVGVSESRVSQILSATAKALRKTLQVDA